MSTTERPPLRLQGKVYVTSRDALLAAGLTRQPPLPTIAAIAAAVGVSRVTFSRVANGQAPVSPAVEAKLLDLFCPTTNPECDLTWLAVP